uniref:Ig-like domain-containing protein n=1 Tax=Sinocyclocheilus anshuiensis TaxID=1608454 RepID=A0A671S949_9TELE
ITLERKKEKPVFQSKLTSAEVTVGESVRFTVTVSGFPKPKVQWFLNGKIITSSTVYRFVEEKDEYTLIITQVKKEYEGEYSCTASNRFGQTTCKTILKVQVSQLSVKFQYSVTGTPFPDVQWFKGNSQIKSSQTCSVVSNPDSSGILIMNNIQQSDSGRYTCKAVNPFGEASCSAELIVFHKKVSVFHKQQLVQEQNSLLLKNIHRLYGILSRKRATRLKRELKSFTVQFQLRNNRSQKVTLKNCQHKNLPFRHL